MTREGSNELPLAGRSGIPRETFSLWSMGVIEWNSSLNSFADAPRLYRRALTKGRLKRVPKQIVAINLRVQSPVSAQEFPRLVAKWVH